MRDFTVQAYKKLLESLQCKDFLFQTFSEFLVSPKPRSIVLRHDVDKLPGNSLIIAKHEQSMGIRGTYYFRALPCSWNEVIIKQIYAMGHEIGYHYESLTTCNGNFEKAFNDFQMNLEKFRLLVPVTSICMHGSPRSKWNNKDLWKKYDYKTLDIIGETYLDTDFSKVLYLTDTGRRWDGFYVSVRDKIAELQEHWIKDGLVFHSTKDLIRAAETGKLPNKLMITLHPQRWNDNFVQWLSELISQRIKNVAKKLINKNSSK
jgi:hypothetical protein